MATTKRTVLTGSLALLVGCLALVGTAAAEADPIPMNMALNPAAHELAVPVPAAWPTAPEGRAASPGEWIDVFGEPSEAPAPQVASFTPPADPAPPVPVSAMPSAAYRVHDNKHVRFFLDRFQTGYRRAIVEMWLTRSGRYLP